MPAGAREAQTGIRFIRSIVFPSVGVLHHFNQHDTTINHNLGIVIGGNCALVEVMIFVCGAQQLRDQAEESGLCPMALRFRSHFADSPVLEWTRKQVVAEDDQIIRFIKAIHSMYHGDPEHMTTYGKAYSWGPAVSKMYHLSRMTC